MQAKKVSAMPTTLPAPVAAYFSAKNKHDIDAMLAPFAETARVKDERKERVGRAAIRAWMDETTRKYRDTVTVIGVSEKDEKTVVTGRVAGDFPGSPVDLRYDFGLEGGKIARLEITLA
jgi:hypothetical protein